MRNVEVSRPILLAYIFDELSNCEKERFESQLRGDEDLFHLVLELTLLVVQKKMIKAELNLFLEEAAEENWV